MLDFLKNKKVKAFSFSEKIFLYLIGIHYGFKLPSLSKDFSKHLDYLFLEEKKGELIIDACNYQDTFIGWPLPEITIKEIRDTIKTSNHLLLEIMDDKLKKEFPAYIPPE